MKKLIGILAIALVVASVVIAADLVPSGAAVESIGQTALPWKNVVASNLFITGKAVFPYGVICAGTCTNAQTVTYPIACQTLQAVILQPTWPTTNWYVTAVSTSSFTCVGATGTNLFYYTVLGAQ